MSKFLTLAAAIAIMASASQAKAGMVCDYAGPVLGAAAGAVSYGATADVVAIGGGATNIATGFLVGYPVILVSMVACDIANGGLGRKYAEAVPGAGYAVQFADVSKLTPAPAFGAVAMDLGQLTRAKAVHDYNVAMGQSDDAVTSKMLATAGK